MTPATRKRLEAAARAIEDRPAAILQAHLEGASNREIGSVAKLSEAGVRKILNNAKGAKP